MNTQSNLETKPLVLWIDDDLSLLMLAERVLGKFGYECLCAVSGEEAITMLSKFEPDIILLDLEMSGMDGIETCRLLKDHTVNKNVPILMVTGHDDLRSINQAYDTGATEFLIKPINWRILNHRLKYLLDNAEAVQDLDTNRSTIRNIEKITRFEDSKLQKS
ncbi:MAG: response regulator [Gammaproteobacteria bacterium]|nr:response regulator [Gammaproteobacteria bacterium]